MWLAGKPSRATSFRTVATTRAWPAKQKGPNISWCHSHLNVERSWDCWDPAGNAYFLTRKPAFLLKRTRVKILYQQKTMKLPKFQNRGPHKECFFLKLTHLLKMKQQSNKHQRRKMLCSPSQALLSKEPAHQIKICFTGAILAILYIIHQSICSTILLKIPRKQVEFSNVIRFPDRAELKDSNVNVMCKNDL